MTNLAAEKLMSGDIGVRVRFMGDLRAVVASSDVRLSLPKGTSVGGLLKSLAERYGDPFAKWLFTGSGDLHHSIVIFVNGENIQDIGGLSARLGEQGDQVEIIMLPMFEGG
jgi:molybdopterin converting factor small subunit